MTKGNHHENIKITQTVEINPNDFTEQQWKTFIRENLSYQEIARTIKNDLFPFSRLKERALVSYRAQLELNEEWGL